MKRLERGTASILRTDAGRAEVSSIASRRKGAIATMATGFLQALNGEGLRRVREYLTGSSLACGRNLAVFTCREVYSEAIVGVEVQGVARRTAVA